MINEKNNFLTVSWLSGLLFAEIFISTGEWGGPDATSDRWKQSSSAVRVSGGYPGNAKRQLIRSSKITNPWDCVLKHTYHFMIWHAPQQNSSAAKLPAKLPNLMGLRFGLLDQTISVIGYWNNYMYQMFTAPLWFCRVESFHDIWIKFGKAWKSFRFSQCINFLICVFDSYLLPRSP